MKTCLCGSADVALYAAGYRCPQHTPAATAGHPEPGQGRYCAPYRCYCGTCPSWDRPLEPVTPPWSTPARSRPANAAHHSPPTATHRPRSASCDPKEHHDERLLA